MISERISRLRRQSLEAVPSISMERASLLTEYYSSGEARGLPVPLARAGAFRHVMRNKSLYVGEGELIVGERGPAPKQTPTYPEICTHTIEDLEILDGREKISFSVTEDAMRTHRTEIMPFWRERSMRRMIFDAMEDEWIAAYEAGIFTEFQEQRAPGHTVEGGKIYSRGFEDLIGEIRERIDSLGRAKDRRVDELKAMETAARALIEYAGRYADRLEGLASGEASPERRAELLDMAAICRKVPARPPDTFHEALQYYWFVHLGVITELNTWDSFNPGRLDRHLYPFYRKGIDDGSLSRERAEELLQAFWIKFNNQPAPPKVGITARESGTYTDFCLINLGGVDENGEDAVNELTYLLLDVIEEMRLLQPSSMVQVSVKSPDRFLERALEIISTGYGQPSIFNTEAIVAEMLRMGKSLADARNGGASGCVETGAFGRESYILTGYLNLPKILEVTMNNGVDPATGGKIGIETGDAASHRDFESFYGAFQRQLRHFTGIKIRGNLTIEKLWGENLPSPMLSLLIDDCVAKGRDYNSGGARYNSAYIQGVGLGTITDSLASIRWNVYDSGTVSWPGLMDALASDFADREDLRRILLEKTPKYGNDEDYPDSLASLVFESFFEAVDGIRTWKGGQFRINMLPTTSHVYFGSMTGALPDGRRSGEPLSEGISPVQGADRKGPTAVLRSASRIDHLRTGGTLLNQKFTPSMLEDTEGIRKVARLVRGYFAMNGHHIQFNVVSAETLRRAQSRPEDYRDLIVRVAGYSDYFVDLGRDLQDEIIMRTEHGRG